MINPSIISINNLNLNIGKQQILKNVNVEIPEKKVTVILGPSGCGKTTLLKCLNRLTDLNEDMKVSGNVFIHNKDILRSNGDITELRKKM